MNLDIDRELAALHRMTVPDLRQRHLEVFGHETGTHNKLHLIRKIAWRIQALAEGDLSERARQRAAELARDADVRVRPPKEFAVGKANGWKRNRPGPDRPASAIHRGRDRPNVQVSEAPRDRAG